MYLRVEMRMARWTIGATRGMDRIGMNEPTEPRVWKILRADVEMASVTLPGEIRRDGCCESGEMKREAERDAYDKKYRWGEK